MGQEWETAQTDLVFDRDSFLAAHLDHESPEPVVNWSLPVNLWRKNLTLETKYIQKPESPLTPEAIQPLSSHDSLLRLRMAAPLVSGILMSEGEVSYSLLSNQRQGLWDSHNRLARLRFTGSWQGVRYAAEVRSVGKTFVSIDGLQPMADQEGGELWAERKFGALKLRLDMGSFWDNLEHESDRFQMTTSRAKVTAYLDRAVWPSVKLAYGRQLESSGRDPHGVARQDRWIDTWESTVDRRIHNWQPSFSSFLSVTHDQLHLQPSIIDHKYRLAASYRPSTAWVFTPTVTWEEINDPENPITTSAIGVLNRYQSPKGGLQWTTAALFDRRDSASDSSRGFHIKSGFDLLLNPGAKDRPRLSLQLDYERANQQLAGESENFSVQLGITVAVF